MSELPRCPLGSAIGGRRPRRLGDVARFVADLRTCPPPAAPMAYSLVFAHAFGHPDPATVVFGSSSAQQLEQNVRAWETDCGPDDERRARLASSADR